ncbi:hypothetical protein KBD08_02020 [Candidatus Babeliales bacterium]|nr:hypothetical protein [Candidatus Babeliales bacterium]
MKLKFLLTLSVLSIAANTHGSYMNDRKITWKTILTGDAATSIDYNIVNNGDGQFGGDIRVYGIHNMWIQVSGYERIDLMENDVCLEPHLFTTLGYFLPTDNIFTQRWACVKWSLPLSFGFNVENDTLHISSTIFKYRFLCLFKSNAHIPLVPEKDDANISDQPTTITVSINGRTAVIEPKTILQIYSLSSFNPYAVLARMLFL